LVGKIEAKAQYLRRNQRGKFPGNVKFLESWLTLELGGDLL
jgi:hypothetical protein